MNPELITFRDFIIGYRQLSIATLGIIPQDRLSWSPHPTAPTALEIGWHLVIWADSDLAHLTHPDPHLLPPEQGTPPPVEVVLRRMNEQIEEINSALRGLRSADEPRTRFGDPSTVRELLAHLMQHEIYHAGQLRYLGYGMGVE